MLLVQYQVLAAFSFTVFVMAATRGAVTLRGKPAAKIAAPYALAAGIHFTFMKPAILEDVH